MSNDPMDFESQKFADKCEAIDQEAKQLESLEIGGQYPPAGFVRVLPVDYTGNFIDCEINLLLNASRPLLSFAELTHELSKQAAAIVSRALDEAEKRAAEQPEGHKDNGG